MNLDININININENNINLNLDKYYLSKKIELKKNINYKLEKDSDICIGFQTNEDCLIKVFHKNNTSNFKEFENIECKKNKIKLLENPIFFVSSFYEDFYIISDKNIDLNIIHTFVNHDVRLNLAQNDFYYPSKLNNKFYFRGFIYEK